MFTLDRVTKRQESANAGTFVTVAEFLEGWKKLGFTQFLMNLTPKKVGGVPNFVVSNGTDDVLVNLGRPVADAFKAGKLTKQELLGLQIADGKNKAGEQRFYLTNNGREFVNVDEVIVAAKKVREVLKAKSNITDISKMLDF